MPTKTLYHSAACKLGPVRVTVKSDVLQSKYPGKPNYVCLEIAGVEWNYSLENPGCGDVFQGQKGNTFTVVFEGGGRGKEDTATVTYVGEAGDDGGAAEAPAPRRSAAPAARRPAPAQAPARQDSSRQASVHNGAACGACVNKAVEYLIAEGIPYDANEVYNRASDLLRIHEALEKGELAPKFSERKAQQ